MKGKVRIFSLRMHIRRFVYSINRLIGSRHLKERAPPPFPPQPIVTEVYNNAVGPG
jgi:hypothetical protein